MVANAAFLAEKSAKEVAEGKLVTLRRSITHKDELLKTLKAKVWTHAPIINSKHVFRQPRLQRHVGWFN